MGTKRVGVVTCFMVLAGMLLAGCSGLSNSFDLAEEKVELRMLTLHNLDARMTALVPEDRAAAAQAPDRATQWLNLIDQRGAEIATPGDANEHKQQIEHLISGLPTSQQDPAIAVFPAAALIPIVAGLAVDAVQAALTAEAAKFERQFGVTRAVDGMDDGSNPYVGFEIVRRTKKRPEAGYDGEAFHTIFLFVRSKADRRIFLVHPFLFYTASAKAKIASSTGMLSSTTDITIDAAWIDSKEIRQTARVAIATFSETGYDLRNPVPVFHLDPTTEAAGWFVGVPKDPNGLGVFRISANVTERDESNAKPTIERVARFLSDNRSTIVKMAGE